MFDTSVGSALLAEFADISRMCIILVWDPAADDAERWLVTVGLDWSGAGATPWDALEAVIEDMRTGRQTGTRSITMGPTCGSTRRRSRRSPTGYRKTRPTQWRSVSATN